MLYTGYPAAVLVAMSSAPLLCTSLSSSSAINVITLRQLPNDCGEVYTLILLFTASASVASLIVNLPTATSRALVPSAIFAPSSSSRQAKKSSATKELVGFTELALSHVRIKLLLPATFPLLS